VSIGSRRLRHNSVRICTDMKHLERIIVAATPDTSVQFRSNPYGTDGLRDFLRDVMALANTATEGTRHIVVGVGFDSKGRRQLHPVHDKDFGGKPDYAALVSDYIEPAVRLRHERVMVKGQQVGVFEIADCQDRPYMMRIDFSETLRRGDAYIRVNDTAIKMGRRRLQDLFQNKFKDSVSAQDIEVGFPGEVMLKDLHLACRDLAELPSAMAAEKLEELMKVQLDSQRSGGESLMGRLVHARLYGSDDPYVSRSPEDLLIEMAQIRSKYAADDQDYMFGSNAEQIQAVVYNQSSEPIIDASLILLLPPDDDLHIAERLPGANDAMNGQGAYPEVTVLDNSIRITQKIGTIPAGEPVKVFQTPLRLCAGAALRGRKFSVRYALFGQNLSPPAKGRLRLLFGA